MAWTNVEENYVMYGGGFFECENNKPVYKHTSDKVTEYLNSKQKNLTDTEIFVDAKNGRVDVYKTCCSQTMTCNYTGSPSSYELISDNSNIWYASFTTNNGGLITIACDYGNGKRIANDEIYSGHGITNATYYFTSSAFTSGCCNGTNIGMFEGCTKLTSCSIPCEMNIISDNTFKGCSSLTSYDVNNLFITRIGESAFENCESLETLLIPKFASIDGYSFKGCSDATTIEWGELSATTAGTTEWKCNLEEIPIETFANCTNLKNSKFKNRTISDTIVIPSGITSIGESAFLNDGAFKKLYLNSVTRIDDKAFMNCSELSGVSNSSNVTIIGESAFENCSNLTSFVLSNNLGIINDNVFANCTSLSSMTIPNSVRSIGSMAFSYCTSLKSCTIGWNVTSIGDSAFSQCYSLSSITIPNSVTSIGEYAFYDCSSIRSCKIGDGVTDIGDSAFRYCTSLTSCTIGDGVTDILSSAFYNCSSLTSVTVNATIPPTLGSYVFYNTNLSTIYVPSGSVEDYQSASGWSDYASQIQAIP